MRGLRILMGPYTDDEVRAMSDEVRQEYRDELASEIQETRKQLRRMKSGGVLAKSFGKNAMETTFFRAEVQLKALLRRHKTAAALLDSLINQQQPAEGEQSVPLASGQDAAAI